MTERQAPDHDPASRAAAAGRIEALDLLRGIAVLGILAVNIAGFAGPPAATYTPRAVLPPDPLSDWAFAAMLVVFEGKMRALFSILFGASLLLFVERADARGTDGQLLQLRRLGWLALFGYLHFVLLWWGDILFLYAVAGTAALALRQMSPRGLLAAALVGSIAWQAHGVLDRLPAARAEWQVAHGRADAGATALYERNTAAWQDRIAAEVRHAALGFAPAAADRLAHEPFEPLRGVLFSIGETLPYMIAGMLLHASGFFAGAWPRRRLRTIAWAGIGLGGAITVPFAAWALANGFPPFAMLLAINYALTVPHWLMAFGYAALIMLCAPHLLRGAVARGLRAAGRMALSNYLLTSVVMTALFNGWGLGLAGRLPYHALWFIVAATWIAMLAWSTAWIGRFGQGPLEWLWRILVRGPSSARPD